MRFDEQYFNWLIDQICGNELPYRHYRSLLMELYLREFTWIVELDDNQAAYGNQLREFYEDRFGEYPEIKGYCTVLEMLIGLAIREEEMMYEPGDEQPETMFWFMIRNLGLNGMTDDEYDASFVNERIRIFLERKYSENGSGGGLFVVKHPPKDMRKVDIWYQMNWFLTERDGGDLRKIGGI